MVYSVKWSDEVKEDFKKLERSTTVRIIQKVEQIKENPFHFLKKLVGKEEWRLRVGDYRVLIDLNNKNEIIYVLKAGHRRKIYDD